MKSVKINSKNVSLKEAKEKLSDDKTIVKRLSLDFSPKRKLSSSESPSHLGFDIEAKLIGDLSSLKNRMNAKSVTLKMETCPKIDNKNLLVMIYDQPEGWRKWLFKIFLKVF